MVFNYGMANQMFGASRSRGKRRHAGIDLGTAGKKGVPVGCPLDGCKVLSVSKRGGYGNTVEVETSDGNRMLFAHLAEPIPKHIQPGVELNRGDWLADVGRTGGDYAIHLHFEYRVPDGKGGYKPVNPVNNPYHTFTRPDFEESTRLAMQQKSGEKELLSAKASEQSTEKEGALQWTFDRGYDQPSWWERHALPIFGGWSQDKLDKAQKQQERDEEVFKGITVGALMDRNVSKEAIEEMKANLKKMSVSGRLSESATPLRWSDLLSDEQTIAQVNKACIDIRNSSNMA